ncbi:hypothetical protein FHR38_003080 [Micromonospora polyrhachis]|uniref:Uncharacterized protein n=1 Tax=Micromonospora polyrhachis TaxID=1282883 RepID=A0A7W7SQY3_9ACTN|nr:hypothetical protein [Micromonospora polyrhachis]
MGLGRHLVDLLSGVRLMHAVWGECYGRLTRTLLMLMLIDQ